MKQISEAVKKNQILYYFKTQWPVLLAVTISGLIYNLGLLAGPWFEGRMTGCLVDILGGNAGYRDMLVLVTAYVIYCHRAAFPLYQTFLCQTICQ